MARKIIDIGVIGNDGTGDSIRDSFRKVNDNFRELYSSLGLGERLTLIGLSDAPDSYVGVNNALTGATPLLTVDNSETGIMFKNLVAGSGISINWGRAADNSDQNIVINSVFSDLSGDSSPQLGGNLSAKSGGVQYRIIDLPPYNRDATTPGSDTPATGFRSPNEAVSKAYADNKLSLGGTETIDPATNTVNTSFGRMSGPLILSRDPVTDDDVVYDGLVAATKRYVDNSSFGSSANLYVATSGSDDRPGVSNSLQGRALAYAYRTLEAALKRAEELVLESRFDIGPYKKTLTYGGNVSGVVAISVGSPAVFTAVGHKMNADATVVFSTGGVLPTGVVANSIYYVLSTDLTDDTFKISQTKGGAAVITTGTQSGVHRFRGTNETRNECTLIQRAISPLSGSGFVGSALMSVDTVTIANQGSFYVVGDILEVAGGDLSPGGGKAIIEVLGVGAVGNILTFRILSTGAYWNNLPASPNTVTDNSAFGRDAQFNLTFKVTNVYIAPSNLLLQSGYSLVSVRITGGGGTGAFGTANIEAGKIVSIVVTDSGSGFTGIPTVEADLPRFLIKTENYRTDYTGDVVNDTAAAIRGRDIREGLFLRGETSGAIAQILSHSGELSTGILPTYPAGTAGCEIFDVDIVFGTFVDGEAISYGDVTKTVQISILVESGIYEENLPLKVPQNVAIIGDEFRRVIIKPRVGTSSSPWAFGKFRRDTEIDGMTVAADNYAWHYLNDPEQPVYPRIDNKGNYDAAAQLISLNRTFLQNEMISWINSQITGNIAPFTTTFTYNQTLCKRDYGLIIDAVVFDMKYSGYNRTVSAALKYYQNASGLVVINSQLDEQLAGLTHLDLLIQSVIDNTEITTVTQTFYPQIIDKAYQKESGSGTVVSLLINVLKDILDESGPGYGSVNQPKDNDEMDVFLCNDANIIRAVTCQGHGGFMMVLDPEGQILTKSPYAQECASFSKSINKQTFAGGQFVDGFAGNLQFQIASGSGDDPLYPDSWTRLSVTGLDRFPNLPCSFIVNDTVYRVNYVRDFVYNKDGSTATLVLDETTPWTLGVFSYNSVICSRDVGYILEGLAYDIVLGTNYNTRYSGLSYRQANAAVVIDDQKNITIRAIEYTHDQVRSVIFGTTYTAQKAIVDSNEAALTKIIDRGIFFTPNLTITNPAGLSTDLQNAKINLLANIDYIKDETNDWIAFTYPSLTYDNVAFAREVGYIVEALVYDLVYGGNSTTYGVGLKYYDGVGDVSALQIPIGQLTETVAAIGRVKDVAKQVAQNLDASPVKSTTTRISGTSAGATVAATIDTLVSDIATTVNTGTPPIARPRTYPDLSAYAYNATSKAARTLILGSKSAIQAETVAWVNANGNLFELLMPGNRSMLANDYTQVNDMGYGIIATNGGLIEAVSMFTYYNYISYYAINGAQIRSIGGSSAHGKYALVAEGSDPLEVPTPTELFYSLSQRVDCYFPSGFGTLYENVENGLNIYVNNYDYTPLNNSELEIDHGYVIYRYPITSVTTTGLAAGIAKLNLTSDPTGNFDGLFDVVPDGTKMTIRSNSSIILTNNLIDVAVRPSTGLILEESPTNVYRVLQFDTFSDSGGPYPVSVTVANPGVFRVTTTVTTIDTNVCTTDSNHKLSVGDKFIPSSTANNFVSGVTYYILTVPNYNQFTVGIVAGGSTFTLVNGTGLSISGVKTHNLLDNYTISFTTTGTLPAGITADTEYFVSSEDLSDITFKISAVRNGVPLAITNAGSGVHSYSMTGLTLTTLRENYNYIDLTVNAPGDYKTTSQSATTISIANPSVVTKVGHGLSIGDAIKFENPLGLPTGITDQITYFVLSSGFSSSSFTFSALPNGTAVGSTGGIATGHSFGKIKGHAGDTQVAVVPLSLTEVSRVVGSVFVFKGEEYVVTAYESELVLNEAFALITFNRALVDNIVTYESTYSIKAAVPVRTAGATGSLTIRIALTRVTGHDLLEIGTGSYADTNYPNEIYGQSVNALNDNDETDERDVGRVFYVTTDQFGNFNVGPYFRVDQGTGRVTFSAAIALSNLDGIGFKRGVPISEFSTDSSFGDNATDTVPTENAARIYIERRLGLTHTGAIVPGTQLIPPNTGGYMALDGQLAMKSDMDLDNNRIINVGNPSSLTDAVNLQSLTFENIQNADISNTQANDIIVFTGIGASLENATVIGDISLNIDSTAHTVDAQINPGVITNVDVNAAADIAQSKLLMSLTSTRAAAPTGTAADKQAASGLASFDSAQFTVTDGWVTLKGNGTALSSLAQISALTLLGNNSTTSTANVSAIAFSDVVNLGNAIKKSQYPTVGFLRKKNSTNPPSDGDFELVNSTSTWTGTEINTLISRDNVGDFAARIADVKSLKVDSYTVLDTAALPSGAGNGYVQLYGYNTASGGIIIQNSSVITENITQYRNRQHDFLTANGASGAPITASAITIQAISSGSSTASGTIQGRWSLKDADSRFQSTYSADLAEYYEGDKDYEVGTVLVFGGDKEVTTTNVNGDTRVAGVVSNTAGFVMYDACPGLKNLVALQGRVPCKVVGKIRKGEMLVTSKIAGVAIAAGADIKVGTVIGKALENYDSDHIGTIEIAVGRA